METDENTIYFFSNTEYSWLSNMYPVSFRAEGKDWRSSEHFYQAHKSLDPVEREKIRNAEDGFKAKKLARKVALRPNWEVTKEMFMHHALWYKFNQNKELLKRLLDTGDKILVEDGRDEYWGNGLDGSGKNRLGILLMQLRTEFKTTYSTY